MDLDRFKNINDTFGHSFGDKLLQKVTERLKLSVYKNCEVFRFDGDSFVILINNSDSIQAEELAKKILQSLSQPLKIEERNIQVSFSIGISMYTEHAANEEMLFQNAGTILENACYQFKRWIDADVPLKSLAVNVSGVQFRDKEFVDTVNKILIDSKLDPKYLDLEITESVTQEIVEATKIMNELKSIGVRLSIDDFGTGYSSFSYLQQFPFDKLKIDKAFIDEINVSSNSEAIISAIIDLGNKLGYDMVAEGVENKTQVEFLQIQNCKYAQGYYYSKPLPVEDLENKFHDQLINAKISRSGGI